MKLTYARYNALYTASTTRATVSNEAGAIMQEQCSIAYRAHSYKEALQICMWKTVGACLQWCNVPCNVPQVQRERPLQTIAKEREISCIA